MDYVVSPEKLPLSGDKSEDQQPPKKCPQTFLYCIKLGYRIRAK